MDQWVGCNLLSHRIHGTGIYTYIYHKNQPNVGKYTSPMDPMGYKWGILG